MPVSRNRLAAKRSRRKGTASRLHILGEWGSAWDCLLPGIVYPQGFPRDGAQGNLRELLVGVPARLLGCGFRDRFLYRETIVPVRDGMPKIAKCGPDTNAGGVLRVLRKIPETFDTRARRQKNSTIATDYKQGALQVLGRGLRALQRQIAGRPGAACRTVGGDRALATQRFARQANGGAELHHRLIPSRRIAVVEQAVGDLLRVCVSVIRPARQHA